jgi:FlaA1/EpsC-like NDP-sugar epimerase
MVRGSNTYMTVARLGIDLIILVAFTLSAGDRLIPNELAKVLVVYCSFLMVVVFSLFHMYQPWQKAGLVHQIRTLAVAWGTVLVVFNLIILLLSNKDQLALLTPFGLFSSSGFNFWAVLVFSGLAAVRAVVQAALGLIRSRGYNQQVAIIIGAGDTGQKLARYLVENRWIGITTAGFFDDRVDLGQVVQSGSKALGTVIGRIDTCRDYIESNKIDLIFLALPMRAEEKITRIVGRLGTSGHAVLMVQDLFSFGIQKARTQQLGELQLMDFYLFPCGSGYSILFFHCWFSGHLSVVDYHHAGHQGGGWGAGFFQAPAGNGRRETLRLLEIQIDAPGCTTPASPPIGSR